MQFARQATVVASFGEQLRDQLFTSRKVRISVAKHMMCGWVAPRQETGTRGGTYLTLRVGTLERHAACTKPVKRGRRYRALTKCADGIESLLIRAVPQSVWLRCLLFHF